MKSYFIITIFIFFLLTGIASISAAPIVTVGTPNQLTYQGALKIGGSDPASDPGYEPYFQVSDSKYSMIVANKHNVNLYEVIAYFTQQLTFWDPNKQKYTTLDSSTPGGSGKTDPSSPGTNPSGCVYDNYITDHNLGPYCQSFQQLNPGCYIYECLLGVVLHEYSIEIGSTVGPNIITTDQTIDYNIIWSGNNVTEVKPQSFTEE